MPDYLSQLPHEALFRLRSDPYLNQLVAPFEHKAFAREWTRENPFVAAPSLAFAIPLYQVLKALNVLPKDAQSTPASLDQIFAGYEGLLQGLRR